MGLLATRYAESKSGLGWPNPGWAPIPGWSQSTTLGFTVDQERALSVDAFFSAVQVIAQDVANMPLIVYRRSTNAKGQDVKERARDHVMYGLLHDSPNPEMTAVVFKETMQAHLLTWGNCYAERELNGQGQTIRLWPLRPDRMQVKVEGGKRVYKYTVKPGTSPIELPKGRVFHIPGMGFDGLIGYNPVHLMRETLAQAIALREYGGRVLSRDARPGVVLKTQRTLSDKALKNIRDSWESTYGGFTNAGRTAVLEEGMDATVLGLPRDDLLFVEGQKWTRSSILGRLRLAPHKIGDLDRATFSNIEEQNIDHLASALLSWAKRWEQQANKDLLPEPDMFAEHLMDAALRGKTLDRYRAYAIAVANKAMTPNEWRSFENWNPVDWGDEPILTPNNSAEMFGEGGTEP